jgi:hypothetical protein
LHFQSTPQSSIDISKQAENWPRPSRRAGARVWAGAVIAVVGLMLLGIGILCFGLGQALLDRRNWIGGTANWDGYDDAMLLIFLGSGLICFVGGAAVLFLMLRGLFRVLNEQPVEEQ